MIRLLIHLIGTSAFSLEHDTRQDFWQPVLRGHAGTGDIIAPIRKLGEVKRKATHHDAAAVAEALVNIRTYLMPKRAKQKF
jgi:uncharacterized protein